MNKKLITTVITVCCVLAAAFILGATGVIDLTRTKAIETKQSDRLIGVIVTTEYPMAEPSYIPGQGISFGPARGVLADRNDESSLRTMPAEYDYIFPGIDGVRLFNEPATVSEDGSMHHVIRRMEDEEFCELVHGTSSKEDNKNGSQSSVEKISTVTASLYYALQDDEVTFFSTPIYQTADGEVYLGECGDGYTIQKKYMNQHKSSSLSSSSSQTRTVNGITTVEGNSITVTFKLVREPVKITLCQFNAAHEMIQADEYQPGEMPRDITPLPETVMVLVDTESKVTDEPEIHSYEVYNRDNTSFYTFRYKDNGYCPQDYHELHWPDPQAVTDLFWKVKDGTLTISGHGRMADYSYQSPVPWYQENYTRLVVEEGITYLGNHAFSNNELLEDIRLPESLTEIGSNVFEYNDSLTEITLPGSVRDIGPYAFSRCSRLRKVTLPDSVKFINTCAFDGCSALEYINLPASVRDFGIKVFRGCGNLRSVTVAEGSAAEWHCRENRLPYDYGDGTPVHLPAGNPDISWKVENDTLFISGSGKMDDYWSRYRSEDPEGPQGAYGTNAPWDNETFSQVVIGNGITSVGESAFRNRSGLYSVTLPKTLTVIEKNAFFGCSDLKEINLDSVKTIDEYAFASCDALEEVNPASVEVINFNAFLGCGSLKTVTLPSTLKEINTSVFRACSGLKEILIPDSVTAIRYDAFCNCTNLEKVVIPASVTKINPRVFDGCKKLKEIVVEKGSAAEQYCIDNNLPCSYN